MSEIPAPPNRVDIVVGSRRSFEFYCRDDLKMDPKDAERNRTAIHFQDWRSIRGLHRRGRLVVLHDADSKMVAAAEREISWMNAEWPEMRGFK